MAAAGFELEGESTSVRVLLKQLWASRGLWAMLARKDFFVRYRRTSFGLVWAVVLPLLQAVVLAIVFSRVARIHISGINYTVFIFSGNVAWSFFSTVFGAGSTAIVDGAGMTAKIYFPRALLPMVTAGSTLYGFAVTVVVLIGLCIVTGVDLGVQILLLLPATIIMVVLAEAFALVFSALHVYFRDMRFVVQAMILVWFYVTPIIYPLALLGKLAKYVRMNPVTGVVEMFRAATVGADPHWVSALWWTFAWIVGLLIVATLLHRRFNRVFADLL
jgi:ABC-type polysaccharide/polyol phosphate export permease